MGVSIGSSAPPYGPLIGGAIGALIGGATGAATSFAGSFVSYGVLNVMTGNSFFANGFWKNVGFSTLSGFASGCISGGLSGYVRPKWQRTLV